MNKKKIKDNLLKAVKQAILQEAIQGKHKLMISPIG